MTKQPFDQNTLPFWTPPAEIELLRRAVDAFNRKIKPFASEGEIRRNNARLMIHEYESKRDEPLKRSRLNF